MNTAEDKQYGARDLEEYGEDAAITSEEIAAQVGKLNDTIKTFTDKKLKCKAASLQKKIREADSKLKKYETQINTSGKRSGYNKTDMDASAMMSSFAACVPLFISAAAGCGFALPCNLMLPT